MSTRHRMIHAAGALLVAGFAAGPAAAWSPADLDTLAQGFSTGIAGNYLVTPYPFALLDAATCFKEKVFCFGANADGVYGYPVGPGAPAGMSGLRLKSTDALVMIMETPPSARYVGVTPYIYSRYYASLPGTPGKPGVVNVFESLTDSVNQRNIGTTGSTRPGGAPFGQLAAFVMTADTKAWQAVAGQFQQLGFPAQAVNLLPLPINEVPLKMGGGRRHDSYSALLRVTYPDDPAALADYERRLPVRTMIVSPLRATASAPLPPPQYKTPDNTLRERADLGTARDQLAAQLQARYAGAYTLSELPVNLVQTVNYLCVDQGKPCNGDNPDALYSVDALAFTPLSRADKLLFVGTDHLQQGTASYYSHSIVSNRNGAGVAALADRALRGSALAMAGIGSADDPRYDAYSQLYAFTLSYDCSGEPVCITVPEPTADNPVGISFGDAMSVVARMYVDPTTGTRPGPGALFAHRVFKLTKN